MLPTYPGQYGSVSGDGACSASDDLVIASTWVNSLRLPIQNAGKPDGWVLQSILP